MKPFIREMLIVGDYGGIRFCGYSLFSHPCSFRIDQIDKIRAGYITDIGSVR